jgi:hypothetical protein
VRAEGLEPSACGLRVRCSTIELCPRYCCFDCQVSPGRLERPTYGFEARRSIHLSYGPYAGAVNSGWARGVSSPEPVDGRPASCIRTGSSMKAEHHHAVTRRSTRPAEAVRRSSGRARSSPAAGQRPVGADGHGGRRSRPMVQRTGGSARSASPRFQRPSPSASTRIGLAIANGVTPGRFQRSF